MWSQQVIFIDTHVCACIYASITRKREAIDLKESRSLWKTVNEGKGKEKCNSITISKISRENRSVFHLKSRNS